MDTQKSDSKNWTLDFDREKLDRLSQGFVCLDSSRRATVQGSLWGHKCLMRGFTNQEGKEQKFNDLAKREELETCCV